jgi:glycosyltransferase involved in cell wall biosynthesis
MASIVEREAKVDSERPVIAAVFYNRLEKNMELQSCATIQYALGVTKEKLYYKDLEVISPYNTYKHKGLPVGPICNPGLSTIKAAINPSKVDYLYFVLKAYNGDGSHNFAKTDVEFEKYKSLISNHDSFEIINKFIPDEEVAELFQKSCLVVLPYIDASQTGVIPIAYAFKKPVIATSVGGIPEVVDDGITGFLVPPRDYISLADKIIQLIKDDNLRKVMGENGYNKTKMELSWSEISLKTFDLYKDTIRQKLSDR